MLADFLAAGSSTPQGLVLDGEAGIGKTTLFEAALAEARRRGFAVFSCRPVGAETAFSFAALADLLAPLLPGGLSRLPSPQRRALSAALLLEDVRGLPPEERAIAVAAHRLFEECGRQPLLIAVDDVQWLDVPSAAILAFVVRRLATRPVAILVARRSTDTGAVPLGLERAFSDDALCRLRLGGLSVGATHRLLRERLGISFPRPTLVRLHEAARGNPFYALEFGRALERSEGRLGADGRVPFPGSLDELVSARLAALSMEVREVLETVALLARPTVAVVEELVSEAGTVNGRLREAAEAGIVVLDGERVRFSHPLLAARVHEELEPRRRRSLHRQLAEFVAQPEERARHLALAAEGPSAGVAEELESAAGSAARRGALAAAAELAELSVSLTPPDADDRLRRRQLVAARYHSGSGDLKRAHAILEPLLEATPPGPERAEVLLRAAAIWDDLEQAERLLDQAFAEAGPNARLRAEIVIPRMLVILLRHGPTAALRSGRGSAEVVEAAGDPVLLARFLSALSLSETLAARVTPGVLEQAIELDELFGPLPHATTPTLVHGLRLLHADEHELARVAFERVRQEAFDRGADVAQANALLHLTLLECRAGEWRRADAHANETLELAEQRGLEFAGGTSLWSRALVDAYLGRLDEARAGATAGASLSREVDDHDSLERNLAVLGFVELSAGNHVAAADLLASVVRRRQAAGQGEPSLYPARELAIEALVAVGDLEEARVQLGWLEEAGHRLATPWPCALGARCAALLEAAEGDLEGAVASCRRALTVHERMPVPFEHARTLLVYGTILRRVMRRKAAREALDEALAIFERLPAPVWADTARGELARIGGRTASGAELTEAERRIADLVVVGKSNKEVAAALFISVHTVQGALKRIFRKLDVHSRTELAARHSPEG